MQAELEVAPDNVRNLFDEMLPFADIIEVKDNVLQLQRGYLDAGIVTSNGRMMHSMLPLQLHPGAILLSVGIFITLYIFRRSRYTMRSMH